MLPSNSEVVRDGIDAGLYSPESLGTLDARARADGEPASEEDVARLMVESGLVTAFQVKLMLQKRTRLLFAGPYTIQQPAGVAELCRYFLAVHRRSGRKYLLAIQRAERTDPTSMAEFVRLSKEGQPPGQPPTRFEGFLSLGKSKVAVFRTPENERSTAEMSTLQTVDGLPIVEDSAPSVDLTGLFEDETDRRPESPELAFTDEDDVIPRAQPLVGHTVGSYGLRAPSVPKRRHSSMRRWFASTRIVMAAVGVIIAGALILLIRHAVRTGM